MSGADLHFVGPGIHVCPKCGIDSGNDWGQCRGICPMHGSPYYHPEAITRGSAPDDFVRLVNLAGERQLKPNDFRREIEDVAQSEVQAAMHSLSSAIGYLLERLDMPEDVEEIIRNLHTK